jgi:hypothetical protein
MFKKKKKTILFFISNTYMNMLIIKKVLLWKMCNIPTIISSLINSYVVIKCGHDQSDVI